MHELLQYHFPARSHHEIGRQSASLSRTSIPCAVAKQGAAFFRRPAPLCPLDTARVWGRYASDESKGREDDRVGGSKQRMCPVMMIDKGEGRVAKHKKLPNWAFAGRRRLLTLGTRQIPLKSLTLSFPMDAHVSSIIGMKLITLSNKGCIVIIGYIR